VHQMMVSGHLKQKLTWLRRVAGKRRQPLTNLQIDADSDKIRSPSMSVGTCEEGLIFINSADLCCPWRRSTSRRSNWTPNASTTILTRRLWFDCGCQYRISCKNVEKCRRVSIWIDLGTLNSVKCIFSHGKREIKIQVFVLRHFIMYILGWMTSVARCCVIRCRHFSVQRLS
jgi:hypothetical protein